MGNNGQSLPKFSTPPIVELVCGVTFDRMAEFKIPHFGLFWTLIKDRFPRCENAGRLGMPEEGFPFPMPRVWMISADERDLVQLQDDRLLLNWRRTSDKDEYPSFGSVFDSFKRIYSKFAEFTQKEGLGALNLTRCELTYVNQVAKSKTWNATRDITQVLPDLGWRAGGRFLQPPSGLSWQASFPLPDGAGTVTVKARTGTRKIDETPVVVLELAAEGRGPDNRFETAEQWFHSTHEWVVNAFTDLTSKELQRDVWGLRG